MNRAALNPLKFILTAGQASDIGQAEALLADVATDAAIAEWFPKLSLSSFLGFRNANLEDLFKSTAYSYSVAGKLLQPLLNFGRIQAGIDLADAQQKEAYLAFEKAVLDAQPHQLESIRGKSWTRE